VNTHSGPRLKGAHEEWPWNGEIILQWLTKTCEACPAQWDGETILGKAVYVRYRHGILAVEVEDETTWRWRLGAPYDGWLEEEALFTACQGVLSATWRGRVLSPSERHWKELWESTGPGARPNSPEGQREEPH
jgi:hypothetical protein